MKKILCILLVVGMVLSSSVSFAQMNRFNERQTLQAISITNDSNTVMTTTLLSTSLANWAAGDHRLVPGYHRLLGYSVTQTNAATTGAAGFGMYFSSATTDTPVNKLEAEAETDQNGTLTIWYPYPMNIVDGIVILLSPRSAVTLYYEQRPAGY